MHTQCKLHLLHRQLRGSGLIDRVVRLRTVRRVHSSGLHEKCHQVLKPDFARHIATPLGFQRQDASREGRREQPPRRTNGAILSPLAACEVGSKEGLPSQLRGTSSDHLRLLRRSTPSQPVTRVRIPIRIQPGKVHPRPCMLQAHGWTSHIKIGHFERMGGNDQGNLPRRGT